MQVTENALLLEEINRLNMNVLTSGYAVLDKEWNYSGVRSPFTRVYLVRSGEGVLSYGGAKITLRPDNIYIIPSGLEINMRCDGRLEKLFFHINLLRFGTQDIFSQHRECIILKNRQCEIEAAAERWRKGDIMSAVAIKELLYRTLHDAIEQESIPLGVIQGYSTETKKAMDFIENNLHAALTAEEIAGSLYVSAGSLQKRFRREVGVPLGRYINDRLMFAAEQLLHTQEYSVKEISDRLGFCDQFYFSRCFVRCFGIPPARYRKNIRI